MGQLASSASECARFSREIRQKPAFHDNNVRVQVTHSWRPVAAKGAAGLLGGLEAPDKLLDVLDGHSRRVDLNES